MRSSRNHWGRLQVLVAQLERCVDSCARLDAHRWEVLSGGGRAGNAYENSKLRDSIYARLDVVTVRIGKEITKITVDRLNADLARRIRDRGKA